MQRWSEELLNDHHKEHGIKNFSPEEVLHAAEAFLQDVYDGKIDVNDENFKEVAGNTVQMFCAFLLV